METKAHYVLVGLFAVWLGRVTFDQEFAEYDVIFQGPVRGLTSASEVRFNGIEVGEVTRLGLDPTDPTKVIARIRVPTETPFRTDSIAQLEPQGLTGLSYIQVSAGTAEAPMLVAPNSAVIPRLQSRQAQLETLVEGGSDVVAAASEALTRLNALMSEENISSLTLTLKNVSALSDQLAEREAIAARASAALAAVEKASQDVSRAALETDRLMRNDVAPMVRATELASIEVDRASKETYAMLEALSPAMERFAESGLDEATLAMSDLRRLVVALEALTVELEDDPAAFVAGGRRPEVEIPR